MPNYLQRPQNACYTAELKKIHIQNNRTCHRHSEGFPFLHATICLLNKQNSVLRSKLAAASTVLCPGPGACCEAEAGNLAAVRRSSGSSGEGGEARGRNNNNVV